MRNMTLSTGFLALLLSCASLGASEPQKALKDGYKPEFRQNDCATISEDSPFYSRSDGTPVLVIYVDTKYEGYILFIDHPKMKGPSVNGVRIKEFDEHWKKIRC